MSSYKCILLVYVKKFSSGHYRIFYRRETVICMGLFDSMKDNMEISVIIKQKQKQKNCFMIVFDYLKRIW